MKKRIEKLSARNKVPIEVEEDGKPTIDEAKQ